MTDQHDHQHKKPAQLICEESGFLPADYSYVTPNDGKLHHVSGEHLQAVKFRMESLGYINIAGGLEPDRVHFAVIARERAPEAAIDWRAVATQYGEELEAVRHQLAEANRRREWAEGEIAVRERQLDNLRKEVGDIQHLLKLNRG